MIWPFIAGAAAAVGEFLHERRTPQPANEVWIVSDEELEAFSVPLARIVARRVPDGIAGDSDTGDALQAGIVATGYGIRNFRDERWLRRNAAQFPQTNPADAAGDDKAPASAPPAAGGVPVSDILARQAPGVVVAR